MPKRIPIKAARDVGREHGLQQVILVAWDGELTHVVTWGKTVEDCSQAADGGNRVKTALGWPESLCQDQPSRVRKLQERVKQLEEEVRQLRQRDSSL